MTERVFDEWERGRTSGAPRAQMLAMRGRSCHWPIALVIATPTSRGRQSRKARPDRFARNDNWRARRMGSVRVTQCRQRLAISR
jgi:hypothetical protein